jgi:hypothetical protein
MKNNKLYGKTQFIESVEPLAKHINTLPKCLDSIFEEKTHVPK